MSKAKQNTFLMGYFAILALGAGCLGYFAWSTSDATTEAKTTYEGKKAQLKALQGAAVFPKAENVDAKKKQVDAYVEKVAGLNQSLRQFQVPLVAMDNGAFQLKLQKTRDAIAAEAKDAGVKLPDPFDMGMGVYLSGTFPDATAVPRLNAWLDGIQSVVSTLIASGVKEIAFVNRPELPFEKGVELKVEETKPKTPVKTSSSSKEKDKKAPAAPVILLEEKAALERYPFSITFTASNRSLNDVLTVLANPSLDEKNPTFFNIRSLRLENEKKEGADTSAQVLIQEQTDPVTQKPYKVDCAYIFGKEKVMAYLGLDLIRFPEPETAEVKK
jgi:hypothetical protein